MVYDNLKTVVEAILAGKERQFNRRFLTLANHYSRGGSVVPLARI
jgi:hypothetical protein